MLHSPKRLALEIARSRSGRYVSAKLGFVVHHLLLFAFCIAAAAAIVAKPAANALTAIG